jgi:hypothetical protein
MHRPKVFFYVCAGMVTLSLLLIPPPANAEGGYTFITKWGSEGVGDGQFDQPYGIATDATGNVFVVTTTTSKFTRTARSSPSGHRWRRRRQFTTRSIATDATGKVYGG